MREFILIKGRTGPGNWRFWKIKHRGKKITLLFGGYGESGNRRIIECADKESAIKDVEKRIREKLKSGYIECTPNTESPPTDATREGLEAALTDDPDDLASHMAYADYLHEQGDPRGDFIQIQLALEGETKTKAARKRLEQQEKALRTEHEHRWLGKLSPSLIAQEDAPGIYVVGDEFCYSYEYSRGWITSLEIGLLGLDMGLKMAESPELRLLKELTIRSVLYETTRRKGLDLPRTSGSIGLDALAKSPYLSNVRKLTLGENQGDEVTELLPLLRNMPKLEVLTLQLAGASDFNDILKLELPRLRELIVTDMSEMRLHLGAIQKNKSLGNLTHLYLQIAPSVNYDENLESPLRIQDFRAILRSKHLKSLKHLGFGISDVGDAGCNLLVESGFLKQLESLERPGGTITDEGAKILADCPDLKNLKHLELSENALTDDGKKIIRAVLPHARMENQHAEDDQSFLLPEWMREWDDWYEGEWE